MWDEWSSVVEIPSLHCAQPPWDASGGVNGHRESLDLGRGRCLEVRLLPLHSYEPFPGVGYFSFYFKRIGEKKKKIR